MQLEPDVATHTDDRPARPSSRLVDILAAEADA